MALELVVGNKTYSSWSLRPWIALTMAGLPFRDTVIQLDTPETKKRILEHSPAGRVPVLHHDGITVWDSLAILEYLAEAFPAKMFWPAHKAARAEARSISAEMHSGFSALRTACPMNLRRVRKPVLMSKAVKADVARIDQIWTSCLAKSGGDFLFGAFSNADAMYAPVATRFDTYEIQVSPESRAYVDRLLTTPAFQTWKAAALKETWIIPADEVE